MRLVRLIVRFCCGVCAYLISIYVVVIVCFHVYLCYFPHLPYRFFLCMLLFFLGCLLYQLIKDYFFYIVSAILVVI